MAFWVYILKCADGLYYTGHTDDLDRRIAQHQLGGYCDFTARRLPVRYLWSQAFGTRLEALEAERQIKSWSRAKKEALMKGDWASVSHFARPPGMRLCGESPSTSLGANDEGGGLPTNPFVSSAVETPASPRTNPSTALGANGEDCALTSSNPFVSSKVETPPSTRADPSTTLGANGEGKELPTDPFVSSAVETPPSNTKTP